MTSERAQTRVLVVVSTLLAIAIVVGLALLASGRTPDAPTGEGTPETTATAEYPSQPVVPDGMEQSTPQASVMTYLTWVSYSYRVADSEVVTATMTPWEHVRIDSYIEFNRQRGRALDQRLVLFEPGELSLEATAAVLPAYEEWEYRYIDIETGAYTTDVLRASYETTYTLLLEDGRWLVDRVEATPIGEVQ